MFDYVLFFSSKCKEHYRFSMFCFSLLVNASNLETVIDNLRSCYTIFCSKYTDENVILAYKYMKHEFQKLGEENVQDGSKRSKKENLPHPDKGHYQQPPSKDFDLM